MIPSSPRRTGIFLLLSTALFFAPDLLVPEAWARTPAYAYAYLAYQGWLVILGFAWGPGICRRLVLESQTAGPLRLAVDACLASLRLAGHRPPPLTLFSHRAAFVLTVGLWPRHCETFLSTGLAARLPEPALAFLLARAAAHATWRQRLADVLPLLAITVLIPDGTPDAGTWLAIGVASILWLCLHGAFELEADRQAGRMLGATAIDGLLALVGATRGPLDRFIPRPPLSWRLRAVARGQGLVTKAS